MSQRYSDSVTDRPTRDEARRFFTVKEVAYAPSWQCDASCKHCFIPRDCRRRDGFRAEVARRLIEGLPAEVVAVGITGGEPFVHPRRLVRLVRSISSAGFIPTVISNGLWIRAASSAERQMERLHGAGLRYLTISVDAYHHPRLSAEELRRLIDTARAVGLDVRVKGTGRNARQMRSALGREVQAHQSEDTDTWEALERVGIAARLRPDQPEHSYLVDNCPYVGRPLVLPDGKVVACCSARTLQLNHPLFVVGKLSQEPLATILDRYSRSFPLAALMAFGPAGMLKRLGQPVPVDATPCGLCSFLSARPDLIDALEETIAGDLDLRKEIVGRLLLLPSASAAIRWRRDE